MTPEERLARERQEAALKVSWGLFYLLIMTCFVVAFVFTLLSFGGSQ